MNWAKVFESRNAKNIFLIIFSLITLLSAICVPNSLIVFPTLWLVGVIISPVTLLTFKSFQTFWSSCCLSEVRWGKLKRAVLFYFVNIALELTLVSLIVLNLNLWIMRRSTVFWDTRMHYWQKYILVKFYVFEVGLYVFYAIHRIALKKMQDRIQARLDEMNARRDYISILPFLLDESIYFTNSKEVAIEEISRVCTIEGDDCAICLEPLFQTDTVDTPCHHKFHLMCI